MSAFPGSGHGHCAVSWPVASGPQQVSLIGVYGECDACAELPGSVNRLMQRAAEEPAAVEGEDE